MCFNSLSKSNLQKSQSNMSLNKLATTLFLSTALYPSDAHTQGGAFKRGQVQEATNSALLSVLNDDGSKTPIVTSNAMESFVIDSSVHQQICIEKPVKMYISTGQGATPPVWKDSGDCIGGSVDIDLNSTLHVVPLSDDTNRGQYIVYFEQNKGSVFFDSNENGSLEKIDFKTLEQPKPKEDWHADTHLYMGATAKQDYMQSGAKIGLRAEAKCISTPYSINERADLCLGARAELLTETRDVNINLEGLYTRDLYVHGYSLGSLIQMGLRLNPFYNVDDLFIDTDVGVGMKGYRYNHISGIYDNGRGKDGADVKDFKTSIGYGPDVNFSFEFNKGVIGGIKAGIDFELDEQFGNKKIPERNTEWNFSFTAGVNLSYDLKL